jgi:hypothetical protein
LVVLGRVWRQDQLPPALVDAGAEAVVDGAPAEAGAVLLVPPLLHATATTAAAANAPPTPATSLVRLVTGPNADFCMGAHLPSGAVARAGFA